MFRSARRLLAAAVATALLSTAAAAGAAPAAAAGATYYVSTTGVNANPGTSAEPFRDIQRAVNVAAPGDRILLRRGTYAEQLRIKTSGTAAARITIGPAGDGPVTVTTSFPKPACSATSAEGDRTIEFVDGADYWTITGLNIVGGVLVKGLNAPAAFRYHDGFVNAGDWTSRRAVPGRGTNDPVAARKALSYISSKTGVPINPSDGIRLVKNKITKVGVQVLAGRYGEVSGNEIYNIACGTGPGLWLNVFSDGWTVDRNYIHDIAASTYKHWMQEGIRLGTASSYNRITNNRIERLPGDGRAYNTDSDPSWNVISRNTAHDVAVGFNDQMSGWGNVWEYNTATAFRVHGLSFRAKDAGLAQPSLHSSTYKATVRCNVAVTGIGTGLNIGGIKSSTFLNNSVKNVKLGRYVAGYWGPQGNTWNGKKTAPPAVPPKPAAGAC
jgi:Right handed beta helix region/Protein of unknown function (DUF1565)